MQVADVRLKRKDTPMRLRSLVPFRDTGALINPDLGLATMSKGVLKVTIPEPAKSEPKKIEVKKAA
jgi:hypothetical protein